MKQATSQANGGIQIGLRPLQNSVITCGGKVNVASSLHLEKVHVSHTTTTLLLYQHEIGGSVTVPFALAVLLGRAALRETKLSFYRHKARSFRSTIQG